MEILTKDKCTKCNGCGMITNPIWDLYYNYEDEQKKETGEYPPMDECKKWFEKQGRYKLPPEELNCSECNGQGEIEKWVSISELKKLLI